MSEDTGAPVFPVAPVEPVQPAETVEPETHALPEAPAVEVLSDPVDPQPALEDLAVDDQHVGPNVEGDASLDDPPVRSSKPNSTLIGSLAVGAGQHVPNDQALYDPDGRPKTDV